MISWESRLDQILQSSPSFMMRFSMKYLQLQSSSDQQELNRRKLVRQCIVPYGDPFISDIIPDINSVVQQVAQQILFMATYGAGYYSVLQKVSHKYLPLHNLNSLQHIDTKIKCYNQFSNQPHQYYACFMAVEQKREADAKELNNNYSLLEEEFKLCNESCKLGGTDSTACLNKCTDNFANSVHKLYGSYYQSRVGNRKQYSKIQK